MNAHEKFAAAAAVDDMERAIDHLRESKVAEAYIARLANVLADIKNEFKTEGI